MGSLRNPFFVVFFLLWRTTYACQRRRAFVIPLELKHLCGCIINADGCIGPEDEIDVPGPLGVGTASLIPGNELRILCFNAKGTFAVLSHRAIAIQELVAARGHPWRTLSGYRVATIIDAADRRNSACIDHHRHILVAQPCERPLCSQ